MNVNDCGPPRESRPGQRAVFPVKKLISSDDKADSVGAQDRRQFELLCIIARSLARIEALLRSLQPLAPFTFNGSSRS